ncbi:Glutaredoxin-related protein [Peptoniphilus asaccharolyticus DSM 20463]|uniref:Glutaredoxin-related protein n=1 Tax=Peptoniphilus asaccharolyticus DSM 20463 TaxID=573058 RepID=A0A1W1V6A2_PEPAS|nr:glutaredoxin domain-containing protein [Peptoniphilus asaccharolyticus]MBL7576358.1 glutaredoxin [Peptoniphilus asaccharolyticus]SMB88544.1 Glutaredoxin-related protein [Peptoniphilus asaccharolyticus DSM 20463]
MITLFVSSLCPDCPPAIEAFNHAKIDFQIIDITESMANLKIFLKYRDSIPFFDSIKEKGQVGVPTIMIGNGERFYSFSDDLDLKNL